MERHQRFNIKTNVTNAKSARSPSPKKVLDLDTENSPLQIACTQESTDNIDVVWDWNSPQAKKQPRKCQKRLLIQSPKVPLKRHPSANSMQDFEKLREELKSLREQLACPDYEGNVPLSPIEESDYKVFKTNSVVKHIPEDEFDDLMDESVNEQLFAFSQQVENDLKMVENKNTPVTSPVINALSPKIHFKKMSPNEKQLANDSFEELLKKIDVKTLQESPDSGNSSGSRTSFNQATRTVTSHSVHTCSGKVEFYRTQSFEMATKETNSKTCTQDEIERKRLEALAKLGAKRKLSMTTQTSQCSFEEIEQKRLQALAKVEAKRQYDIIERKRQDALKRLQMKRQKNVTSVKSSLATRLK